MRRFVVIGVAIFLIMITLLVVVTRGGDRPAQDSSVARPAALADYADTSTEVRFTLEGSIVARENRRAIQITVGRDYRTVELFDGYQGNVMKSETLSNDQDAYRAFLSALHNSGYTKTRVATRGVEPLGACPNGSRYHYDILGGSETIQTLWSTSCNGIKGTFAGNASTVRTLFQAQVPDYQAFVQGVQF